MATEADRQKVEETEGKNDVLNTLSYETNRLHIDVNQEDEVSQLIDESSVNCGLTDNENSSGNHPLNESERDTEILKGDTESSFTDLDNANNSVVKDSISSSEEVNEDFFEARTDLPAKIIKETNTCNAIDSRECDIETGKEPSATKGAELITGSETESDSSTSEWTGEEYSLQESSHRTNNDQVTDSTCQGGSYEEIHTEHLRGSHEAEDGNDSSDTEGEYESADEGEEIQVDADQLKNLEESLTDEQKEEQRNFAQVLKEEGNELFRCGSYKSAIKVYSRALRTCPLKFAKDRSIMYSNRAVCKMKLNDSEAAIRDCSKALDLNPHYMKALMRRAELYENSDKLDEALVDYQKMLELDPSLHSARAACMRLPDQIKERNEKLKAEMMDKLKDLGNLVLRPFGLSTNNFQLNQDPNTGGYSVNFVQNPGQ